MFVRRRVAEVASVSEDESGDLMAELARDVGIRVTTLDEARWLDLTIDGADEFDGEVNLIKGGGGALLQEKTVRAFHSTHTNLPLKDDGLT